MDKRKTISIGTLVTIGLLMVFDLIWIFFKNNFGLDSTPSFCNISSFIDCDSVSTTNFAMFLGIPLALWGFILYATIVILLFTPKIKEKFPNSIFNVFKNPYSYIATLSILSFCISMCLALISIFAIGKICILCFGTYFIDLFIAFSAKTEGSFFLIDIKNTVADFIDGFKNHKILAIIIFAICAGILTYTSTSYVLSPQIKRNKSFEEFQKMKVNPYKVEGNILGNQNGVVKVYIYSDFLCPFCRIANIMVHKLAHENKNVQVIHVNFPLDSSCNRVVRNSVHPNACLAARYALAAEEQGKYWEMANAIYDQLPKNEKNPEVAENNLIELAHEFDLDINKLTKDAHSNKIDHKLLEQIESAIKSEINSTPTTAINDIIYEGMMPYYILKERSAQVYQKYVRDNEK